MHPGNIHKVVIIRFCQRFHLYIHAYALLLLGRGLTLIQISLIESLVIGTIFLMEVPTGILADRVGRKWSIFFSTLLLMSAEFIFIFARSFEWYLVIAVLAGSGFAFASGAVEALVYDSLPSDGREDAMKRAMGRVGSVGQIAFVIAPVVGGFIIADAAPEKFIPAIALTVAALFVGLCVSMTLHEPMTDSAEKKASSAALFRQGISLLRHHHRLRRLAGIVIFTSPFTAMMVTILAPPYLIENGACPPVVAVTLSLGSLMAALTQHYAYKIEARLGQQTTIALLILLPGVLYWILAWAAGPTLTALLIFLMYGTNDMKAPLFSAYQNALIDSNNRATVLSLINMFVSLFLAVGAPTYAALAQSSMSLAFAAMGAVIIIVGLMLRAHRLPEVPENAA